MTFLLRDYFAVKALRFLMRFDLTPAQVAEAAYGIADAMLAERDKGGKS